MKGKTKTQKGITLIALIITIVVLLILAVVAINSIQDGGILSYATNAATDYNKAVANESQMLQNYVDYLDKYSDKYNSGSTPVEPKIGQYVEYDVSYTDMYSGNQYTKATGWKYLGEDAEGNKLIISTGIPAILNYDCNPEILPTWWATEEEVKEDTGIYNTNIAWNNQAREANKFMTYGLRYKFESIPYTYKATGTSVSTANTGIFRQVGNSSNGENITLNFRASGVEVKTVRNITKADVERADVALESVEQKINFFDVGGQYILATPEGTDDIENSYVWRVLGWDGFENVEIQITQSDSGIGIRPVIVLESDVIFTNENEDELLEIK